MFRKRKIEIQLPAQTVIDCLKNQLRVRMPWGWVRENSFCLYKRVAGSPDLRFALLCFTGTLDEKTGGTQVTYRVRPGAVECVFLALFSAALVYTLISLLMGSGNILIVLLAAAFNGCLWLWLLWQKRVLVERFEKKLLDLL